MNMCKGASLSAGPGRVQRFPRAVAPQVMLEDWCHSGSGDTVQCTAFVMRIENKLSESIHVRPFSEKI